MTLSENSRIPKESSGLLKKSPLRNLLVTVAAILLVSFIIIMINQAAQLVNLAMQIHPTFGKALFGFFILLALATVVWTVLLIVGLEKPLPVPDETDTEAYNLFLSRLKKRLKGNPFLKQKGFVWPEEKPDIEAIPEAIAVLDEEGKRIIRSQAATVFITTAVSQNGSLDSLFVFVTVFKLVWRMSKLYHQRPAIRDLIKLYSQIFGTVLMSRQIDDLDLIAEQLEPVLTTVFGGTVGNLVPGVSYVVSFVVDSIFEGSLNTLLTLRVGFVAQSYCRSIVKVEPRKISHSATIQACSLLGTIIGENSKKITQSLLRAVKNATVHTFDQRRGRVTDTLGRLFHRKEKGPVES